MAKWYTDDDGKKRRIGGVGKTTYLEPTMRVQVQQYPDTAESGDTYDAEMIPIGMNIVDVANNLAAMGWTFQHTDRDSEHHIETWTKADEVLKLLYNIDTEKIQKVERILPIPPINYDYEKFKEAEAEMRHKVAMERVRQRRLKKYPPRDIR